MSADAQSGLLCVSVRCLDWLIFRADPQGLRKPSAEQEHVYFCALACLVAYTPPHRDNCFYTPLVDSVLTLLTGRATAGSRTALACVALPFCTACAYRCPRPVLASAGSCRSCCFFTSRLTVGGGLAVFSQSRCGLLTRLGGAFPSSVHSQNCVCVSWYCQSVGQGMQVGQQLLRGVRSSRASLDVVSLSGAVEK